MKFKALALVGALLAAPVVAQPIYIDIGADYGGNANYADGTTTTGWINQLQFNYNSWSTVFDADDNGLDAGDIITSTGGLLGSGFTDFSLYGNNNITSFLPKQFGSNGPSNNGYANGWELSFGFNNLTGVLDGLGGVNWVSGTISFYVTTDIDSCTGAITIGPDSVNCFTRMFDLNVTNGGNIPSATILNGYLSNFNTTDSINGVIAGDIFNTTFGGSSKSFRDINDILADDNLQQTFQFFVDQNVEDFPAVTGYDPVTKTFTLAEALHDGSLSFVVPEPTSIAILGLGLLGLGLSRRRQA